MIQINELRVGNLIQEGKVEQIDNSIDEVYYSGDGYYLSNYCCNLNPIQLTEEWLLKFGFDETKEMEDFFSKTKYKLLTKGALTFWYYPMWNGIENKNYEHIKNVHQLQNLYYSLVGSELQLLEAGI